MEILFNNTTDKIIRCFYNVYDELGTGFLESIYEKSLIIELRKIGLKVENQKELKVYYKNYLVGNFKIDLLIENKIIIEIKAVSKLIPQHEAQLLNYLKATKIKVGLIVNFGEKLEFKKKIY